MEQEKVEVSGTKTWDDSFNQDGKRPTSIKSEPTANGSKVQEKTVNMTATEDLLICKPT